MNRARLTEYLHQHIPLTAAMGLTVAACDPKGIRLRCPLDINLNHQQTAFGGSIATAGIVGGWALLHLRLCRDFPSARLVIQSSQIDYRQPIPTDFDAICSWPTPTAWDTFAAALRQRGRARLVLRCEMVFGKQLGAVHEGKYVALLPDRWPQPAQAT